MDPTTIIAGSLFTRDYLTEAIVEAPEWRGIEPEALHADLAKVSGEWAMVCTAHNLLKLAGARTT